MKNKEFPSGAIPPDFERMRTKYFSHFAQSHASAFRPHYKRGETLGKGPEIWRNVSEHCLIEAIFADILSDELHLPSDQKSTVIQAAILHDWFKKHESKAQIAAKKEGIFSLQTIQEIKNKDSEALCEMGIPEDVIRLTGSNTPETPAGPETLLEQILWYVDAMLSNTEPMPIRQRFDDLERGWDGTKEDPVRAERNKAMSGLYREKYEGKSMYEVQRNIGDALSAKFSRIIGYQGEAENLPLYLKEKLRERMSQFS